MNDRSHLLTELRLPESMRLDAMCVEEAVDLMNQQDQKAVQAVGAIGNEVARATQIVADALQQGGRLIYFGAGTSGRLGVLDASECPPTFRTDPDLVQGVIAGGPDAMFRAKEGAEDSPEGGRSRCRCQAGHRQRRRHGHRRRRHDALRPRCASPTPASWAPRPSSSPASRLSRTSRRSTSTSAHSSGPEILTGSTRLKAGTATKLVLNTITTLAMVQLGKVYENLMVDLRASNAKLCDRAARIVSTLTGRPRRRHERAPAADGHVKLAVVMHRRHLSADQAKTLLDQAGGQLRKALE